MLRSLAGLITVISAVLLACSALGQAEEDSLVLFQTYVQKQSSPVAASPELSADPQPENPLGTAQLGHHHRAIGGALVRFVLACAASHAIGSAFPRLSFGILPQISGYLMMGIIAGPFCVDLLRKDHMQLISGPINRICLAFIAGAAGAEMYLPELRSRLLPMLLQVFLISFATLALCFTGVVALTSSSVLHVPALIAQPTVTARMAVTMLAAVLMTARSPASAIAVIAELDCSELTAAKVTLGVTVLSDVAVLVFFSVCMQMLQMVVQNTGFGLYALLGVASQLLASVTLGAGTGLLLWPVLPVSRGTTKEAAAMFDLRPVRGAVLIAILYAAGEVATRMGAWSHDHLRLEPLLVCATAASVSGHDQSRRAGLLESLMWWTQFMVLPFFTIAGASLDLPELCKVFPAAITLMALRLLGIACGSTAAGAISQRLDPRLQVTSAEVHFTWLTLVAQAGVTLGLVLEVREAFPGWGADFATLISGVVVLNQFAGPVLCRLGLQMIIDSKKTQLAEGSQSPVPFEAK